MVYTTKSLFDSSTADNLLDAVTKYKGILQSYDKNTGFWETKHHLRFLIPEENIMSFSNYKRSL